ncbi:MAG TPA: nitrous oxide reductase family maturation protein NosD, partial [Anaerolineae bacterium]|nr:nitrous oxide reductase family maturation protein NosD [Anaerolineae bacterium]
MPRPLLLAILLLTLLASVTAAQSAPFDLAAALAAAQPGDTIVVPPGVYAGPVVVDVPGLTLEGQEGAVIDGGGLGDVVTITAPDVILRGLTIRHSGKSLDQEHAGITGKAPRLLIENNQLEDVLFGIYLKEAPDSVLRSNRVTGMDLPISRRGDGVRIWQSPGALVEGNYVYDTRDVVMWFASDAVLRGNVIENGRYGLHFMFSDNQTVEENILRSNSVGAYLMYSRGLTMTNNLLLDNYGPSGYGVALKDVDDVHAVGNRIVNNRVGIYVDNSPREGDAFVIFEDNLTAYNEIGIEMLPSVSRNVYTNNIFQENREQVAIAGGGELRGNDWARAGWGNYWSDYAGFDADGDLVGDLPYRSTSLYENLMEKYPNLRLFQLSPATDALDLAARAFPLFQPRAKMADEFPLMTPPEPAAVPGVPEPPLLINLAAALGMLALAGVVL